MQRIAVITKVADPSSGGNLAMGDVYLDPQAKGGTFEDPHEPIGEALGQPLLALYVRVPVFRVGEILLLDGNDRDQFGRKPNKWSVDCTDFDTLDEAAAAIAALGESVAEGAWEGA